MHNTKHCASCVSGLFYKFFPGDKATIQDVYRKMADGLNSFNFNDLASTADETALSRMIINIINALGGQQSFDANPLYSSLVVNVAKMFYDLMKVTPTDYTRYIDSFSEVKILALRESVKVVIASTQVDVDRLDILNMSKLENEGMKFKEILSKTRFDRMVVYF